MSIVNQLRAAGAIVEIVWKTQVDKYETVTAYLVNGEMVIITETEENWNVYVQAGGIGSSTVVRNVLAHIAAEKAMTKAEHHARERVGLPD